MNNIWIPLILTLLAGLSTVLGAVFVFVIEKENRKFLSGSLGLSAGVMIYVSFMEMMPQSLSNLEDLLPEKTAVIYMTIFFFLGIFFIALIDKLVPEEKNPHHALPEEIDYSMVLMTPLDEVLRREEAAKLERVGVLTAITVAIHNFPEGIATFMSAMINPQLGIVIAIAIGLHNIPEGIAVAVPIFQATGSKKRAISLALISGLAEPLGGIIGYLFLRQFLNPMVIGFILAFVAGIMVFISLDELLPTSREYDEDHFAVYGLVVGMLVMAVTMIILD